MSAATALALAVEEGLAAGESGLPLVPSGRISSLGATLFRARDLAEGALALLYALNERRAASEKGKRLAAVGGTGASGAGKPVVVTRSGRVSKRKRHFGE